MRRRDFEVRRSVAAGPTGRACGVPHGAWRPGPALGGLARTRTRTEQDGPDPDPAAWPGPRLGGTVCRVCGHTHSGASSRTEGVKTVEADESALRAVGWARSLPMSSSVKEARDWTRAHLETLGWSRTAPDTVDGVLLTVSELVTNAHLHARGPAQLILTWDSECLHVTVHDDSSNLPEQRQPASGALGGRGMLLVDALADSWRAFPCPHGKEVTACFRPPRPAAAQETQPNPPA